jgi:hypothetical protein
MKETCDCHGRPLPQYPVNRDYVPGKNAGNKYFIPKGFPQGANISPFLSILQLVWKDAPKFANLLMYADDGLFYSDNEFTAEQVKAHFDKLLLEISPEKSG